MLIYNASYLDTGVRVHSLYLLLNIRVVIVITNSKELLYTCNYYTGEIEVYDS